MVCVFAFAFPSAAGSHIWRIPRFSYWQSTRSGSVLTITGVDCLIQNTIAHNLTRYCLDRVALSVVIHNGCFTLLFSLRRTPRRRGIKTRVQGALSTPYFEHPGQGILRKRTLFEKRQGYTIIDEH